MYVICGTTGDKNPNDKYQLVQLLIMPNFKNFANGGAEDGNTSEFSSIRHKQIRDTRVGSRIERVWAIDFDRCESREDFEKYISKYGKYDANKYVEQARAKIESFDAAKNERIEREKAAQRVQQRSVAPGIDGRGIPPQKKIVQSLIKVAVWIIIIGGVGLYSYNQYQKEENAKEETSQVVVDPQPSQNQTTHRENTTHTHQEQTHQQESPVVEPEPEPQEVWWDCNICGTTGRCRLCLGSGCCGVCGGRGSLYRSSGWIDCEHCGSTGRCPSCDGSGACFACHGTGRCKLEE